MSARLQSSHTKYAGGTQKWYTWGHFFCRHFLQQTLSVPCFQNKCLVMSALFLSTNGICITCALENLRSFTCKRLHIDSKSDATCASTHDLIVCTGYDIAPNTHRRCCAVSLNEPSDETLMADHRWCTCNSDIAYHSPKCIHLGTNGILTHCNCKSYICTLCTTTGSWNDTSGCEGTVLCARWCYNGIESTQTYGRMLQLRSKLRNPSWRKYCPALPGTLGFGHWNCLELTPPLWYFCLWQSSGVQPLRAGQVADHSLRFVVSDCNKCMKIASLASIFAAGSLCSFYLKVDPIEFP